MTGEEDEFESFSLSDAPPPGEVPAAVRFPRQELQCPSCGTSNPATNRHCEECGARLSQGALPVAPRPAVQTTAGVRAAMAISGLLFGVVVIAVLFNIFGGDDGTTDSSVATDTTVASTTATPEPAEIDILSVDCSVDGLAGFECRNLIDNGDGEYQINWETLEEGQDVNIRLVFNRPMVITGFVWENLDDGNRFFQNYRAKSISVSDGSPNAIPLPLELRNEPGPQPIEYASLRALSLEFTVNTVYLPETREGRVFTELAVKEIRVVGYPDPSTETTTTTAPTSTTGG